MNEDIHWLKFELICQYHRKLFMNFTFVFVSEVRKSVIYWIKCNSKIKSNIFMENFKCQYTCLNKNEHINICLKNSVA